jgi:hypothetical protein
VSPVTGLWETVPAMAAVSVSAASAIMAVPAGRASLRRAIKEAGVAAGLTAANVSHYLPYHEVFTRPWLDSWAFVGHPPLERVLDQDAELAVQRPLPVFAVVHQPGGDLQLANAVAMTAATWWASPWMARTMAVTAFAPGARTRQLRWESPPTQSHSR